MSRLDKFGTKYDRWAQGKHYDARSSWKILVGLASAMGQKLKYNMAEEVFLDIANSIDAFKGLDYDVTWRTWCAIKISDFKIYCKNLGYKEKYFNGCDLEFSVVNYKFLQFLVNKNCNCSCVDVFNSSLSCLL